jgi:hypothetical protein
MEDESFLPLKRDVEETAFTWDAAAWPEGWYMLKIVARDARSQPPGEGLTGEAFSETFLIDNTPPRLEGLCVESGENGPVLLGKVEDALSRITLIEYSLNGEGWRPALPVDRILDARTEEIRIPVPALDDGGRASTVGVRVADEVGHVAGARLRLPGE